MMLMKGISEARSVAALSTAEAQRRSCSSCEYQCMGCVLDTWLKKKTKKGKMV